MMPLIAIRSALSGSDATGRNFSDSGSWDGSLLVVGPYISHAQSVTQNF